MKKILYYLALSLWPWLFSHSAIGEIYKWTDKNGKVHYSDNKGAKSAEDIGASLNKTNIDTSTAEHQKLEMLFRKENAADRAYQAEQAMPDPAAVEHQERCLEAKKRLKILEGRVQFIDSEGKPVRTTEEERKQRAEKLRNTIAENCPG